jgi:SAM-dependent methyltransferase
VPTLAEIADEAVDLVISCHALEHVESPIHILRELRRVLRPGGKIPGGRAIRDGYPVTGSACLVGGRHEQAPFHLDPADPWQRDDGRGLRGRGRTPAAASNGSRLLNHLGPLVGRTGKFLKALRAERFEAVVTAVKPS